MTDFRKLIPPFLNEVETYKPGKSLRQAELESGVTCIKLASNENPFGPSPLAIEAIKAAASGVNFYPDNAVTELTACLAAFHEVKPEQIMVTAGSTTFLDIIARTLLGPGLNAITSKLSFIVYPIVTRATGAQLIEVPTLNDGFDLERILDAVNENTRVVYLANPNNPTGTIVDANAIDRFLDRLPANVITVLDEAYYDYATYFAARSNFDYSHALEYVRQERPVVVLRTFSKAHGLAGLRVGYGLGPAELMSYFARMKPAFMVSTLGEAAAISALADADHLQRSLEANASGREMLTEALQGLGIRVIRTWTNFLYCHLGEDVAGLCQTMQEDGIIVRPMSGVWGAPDAFRVTIGTPAQNQHFLSVLKRALARVPAKQ